MLLRTKSNLASHQGKGFSHNRDPRGKKGENFGEGVLYRPRATRSADERGTDIVSNFEGRGKLLEGGRKKVRSQRS